MMCMLLNTIPFIDTQPKHAVVPKAVMCVPATVLISRGFHASQCSHQLCSSRVPKGETSRHIDTYMAACVYIAVAVGSGGRAVGKAAGGGG